ncbi:transporter [Flavobacterium suaedae]|uniref:Transporter n=1 Tax=Flavobacterium suaedae TaxID=1767027 RepID=A0ABQ1K0P7_9FLAO|nr:DUF6691 family protein [Flavobacterium suaedae]GGB81473.1 transporter [Flavobacterium suaedae]
MKNLAYIITGLLLGVVLYKSEAASWFRIYEMFQFKSFHMYGIIGTAVVSGVILTAIIKKFRLKDVSGNPILFAPKNKSFARYFIGGTFFGLGWALAGACPGPMFVLAGAGYMPMLVVILGAVLGTWFYGLLKDKLPH